MAYKNKEDAQRWYREHRDVEIQKALQRNKEYITRNVNYINELKSSTACFDCGVRYIPCVMHFDHTGNDKSYNVSNLARRGGSLEALKKEIAKCDLVCANCHAIRTHKRREV